MKKNSSNSTLFMIIDKNNNGNNACHYVCMSMCKLREIM